ncbi:DUF4340 domain-containing protein [Candidatus Sumerlaeota bacterium]|nr:DUF4340 domain-containing protein [Candidatus Sumerlaeota bacterium]
MKTRNLVILLVVAALAVVAAIVSYRRDTAVRPGKPSEEQSWRGAKLLPSLVDRAGDIYRIEIDRLVAKIALVRDDRNNWRVETAGGYPADNARVRRLVFDLSELVASDRFTDDPAKYGDFGVGEGVGTEGTVRMTGSSGEEIASLALGKAREIEMEPGAEMRRAWGGQFVRVGGDPFVYLANDRTYADTALTGWVETNIARVSGEDVEWVRIDHATTEPVRLAWDDGKLQLEGPVPEGMQPNENKIRSVRGALDYLHFTNVIRADSEQAEAIDFTSTCTLKTLSGSVYAVRVGQRDEATTPTTPSAEGSESKKKYFVGLSARYDEPFFTDDDTATTESLAAAKEKARKAEESVPEFNESHAPWLFEIPKWNCENLAPARHRLIEPRPAPTTPAPDESAPAAEQE